MTWREKVLSRIKPNEEESNTLKSVQIRTMETVKKYAKNLEVTCVGSTAKDTWLRGANDIDIFIKFPTGVERQDLEKRGLEIGKKTIKELKGKYVIAYAEHPYVRGEALGYKIEIVPCYSVETPERIQSAVDRSPFHLEYVNSHLKFGQRDEVRLLKAFLKANNLYGADLKTEGFSGYLCELLIIAYGTFHHLLLNARKWHPGISISLKHSSNHKDPLVLIDPVDPKRNVAAAVSAENLMRFIGLSREFIKKPSERFFETIEYPDLKISEYVKIIKSRKTELIAIRFEKPDIIDDILYPQLRRFTVRIQDILRHYEFVPLRSDFLVDGNQVYVIIEMEIFNLPAVEKKYGPNIYAIEHTEEFLNRYKNPLSRYIENGVWVVEVPRKFTNAYGKLKDSLKDSENVLKEKGIPSYIAKSISRGHRLFDTAGVKELMKNKKFCEFLYRYFNKII